MLKHLGLKSHLPPTSGVMLNCTLIAVGLGRDKLGTAVADGVDLCCPKFTSCHWCLQMQVVSQENLGSVGLGSCLVLSRFKWCQPQSPALPPWDPLSNQAKLLAIDFRGIIWRNNRSMWMEYGIPAPLQETVKILFTFIWFSSGTVWASNVHVRGTT